MSAKKALDKYFERQLVQLEREKGPRRKNGTPELEVQKHVMAWLKENGFSCNVVQSRATYSLSSGRYLNGQTVIGFTDVAGACPNGLGAFIEIKAPGKRHTLREGQREFIKAKIGVGAFACVVDSVECLSEIWKEFEHRHRMDPQLAKALLYRHLPREKQELENPFGER